MALTSGIGVAAGPGQIAGGSEPTNIAEVDDSGALKVQGGSTSPGGVVTNQRVNEGGEVVISSAGMIRELLIELRLLTAIMAEAHFVTDTDLAFRRADIDRDLDP